MKYRVLKEVDGVFQDTGNTVDIEESNIETKKSIELDKVSFSTTQECLIKLSSIDNSSYALETLK